eukprot:21422-Hanusia_phi.AAC.1
MVASDADDLTTSSLSTGSLEAVDLAKALFSTKPRKDVSDLPNRNKCILDKLCAVQYMVCMILVTSLPANGRRLTVETAIFLPSAMVHWLLVGTLAVGTRGRLLHSRIHKHVGWIFCPYCWLERVHKKKKPLLTWRYLLGLMLRNYAMDS